MMNVINIVHTDKLYDLTKLREMLDGNDNAVNTMVKKFIKSTTQFLLELNKYAKTRDYDMVSKLLYNVNFSLNILGITSLNEELANIEQYTTDKTKSAELKNLINKLNELCNIVFKQLGEDFT